MPFTTAAVAGIRVRPLQVSNAGGLVLLHPMQAVPVPELRAVSDVLGVAAVNTNDAMRLSDVRFFDHFPEMGSEAGQDLRYAWELIPRDPGDKGYKQFWKTVTHIADVPAVVIDPMNWLVMQSNHARVARIISVCWLVARGKVKNP